MPRHILLPSKAPHHNAMILLCFSASLTRGTHFRVLNALMRRELGFREPD